MNENVIKMARLMVGCKDRTCEDCLSQSKKLFGDNKCALIEYAEVLDKAGYRKESEEEINKIIITAKRKLYDANLESVNRIMGEREKDIKQAWQNGYNKAREEVVKEFAEKVNEVIEACERQDGYDAEGSHIYTIDTAILRVEMEQIAEQFGKEEK